MYSIKEEQPAEPQVDSSRIRDYLGKDPSSMGLSEREKMVCKILMKNKELSLVDAQHVGIDEILYY